MNLLESLPTVIGTAAIAPALLILWLVVAAGERPGPPLKVWTAFLLGAASISLLGVARAPFAADRWRRRKIPGLRRPCIRSSASRRPRKSSRFWSSSRSRRGGGRSPIPWTPWSTARRRASGFAAYENLAYLVQHAEMWRALAALRSVLTVPFHGALGIIAGAYLAIARSGTALGAHRHHRDWARISSRILVVFAPVALHAAFDFPLLTLQQNPDIEFVHPADPGSGQRADRVQLDRLCGAAGAAGRSPSCAPHRDRARAAEPVATDVGAAGGGRRRRICRPGLCADVDPPLAGQSRTQRVAGADSGRPRLDPDRHRPAGHHHGDLFSRPQPDARDVAGLFLRARPRLDRTASRPGRGSRHTNLAPRGASARAIISALVRSAGIGRFPMTLPQDITNLQSKMSAAVREHWKAFLFEGILLVVWARRHDRAAAGEPCRHHFPGLDVPDQRRRRPGADILGAADAGLLVVADFGGAGGRRRHHPAGTAGAGHADAHDRGRRLFPRRRRRHHHVCAGASPRIVGALVLAAGGRADGYPDRRHHHRGTAGLGAVGRRPAGRHQPVVRRRVADRHGARRAQGLTAQQPRQMLLILRSSAASSLIDRIVRIAQVLLRGDLIGARLAVTDRRFARSAADGFGETVELRAVPFCAIAAEPSDQATPPS